MSLFSAPLFSTSFVIYMKGLVDKSLSSQNGNRPNFIFHARKEFVIITRVLVKMVLESSCLDGLVQ